MLETKAAMNTEAANKKITLAAFDVFTMKQFHCMAYKPVSTY